MESRQDIGMDNYSFLKGQTQQTTLEGKTLRTSDVRYGEPPGNSDGPAS